MKKGSLTIVFILCIGVMSTIPAVSGESSVVPTAVLVKSSITRIYTIEAMDVVQEQLPTIELDEHEGLVLELSSSAKLLVDVATNNEKIEDRIQVFPN